MAQSKQDLENIWRERVRQARARYEEAHAGFRAVWDEHFHERMTADPSFAIEQAHKAETAALRDYMKVLKIFMDLVLHGKVPREPKT